MEFLALKKKYRNEWKYCCSEYYLQQLTQRIQNCMLEPDDNMNSNGFYRVRSLYFDDRDCSCALDVDSGYVSRFKYRLRYYDNRINTLRLELKEKLCGRCRKYRCAITSDEYKSLINGDVWEIIYNTQNNLLKKFCVDIVSKNFSPKVITDYERNAYIDKNLNIRVTIDRNIYASKDIQGFLEGEYGVLPIQYGNNVLEVKFDEILPKYLKDMVNMRCLSQTSFSKYYIALQKIKRN